MLVNMLFNVCVFKPSLGTRHHVSCLFALRNNLYTNDIFSMKIADFVSDENFQGGKTKNAHFLHQVKCL